MHLFSKAKLYGGCKFKMGVVWRSPNFLSILIFMWEGVTVGTKNHMTGVEVVP